MNFHDFPRRNLIPSEIRIPILVVMIGAIVTNCAILGRVEAYASRLRSWTD